jgi:hypothetical protein
MKTPKRSACFMVLMLVFNLAAIGTLAWAGCKTDCRDEYDSEVESCKSTYDDPDDADELQQCIQNAKDEYESCIEECDS